MANREIAQKVIDFQFSRVNIRAQRQRQQEEDSIQLSKFSLWNLDKIIMELGLKDNCFYKIKWIGHEQECYVDAFVYCLFQGCRTGVAVRNGVFIKLKFSIYQLASKHLKMSDQKNIVQVLCGAQYTKDLATFLNRNQSALKLFKKLIQGYLLEIQNQVHLSSGLQKLKLFSSNFDILKLNVLDQEIGEIHHFDQKFYIIREKGCYFVVEAEQQNQGLIKLKKIIQTPRQNQVITPRQVVQHNSEEKKIQQRAKFKQYVAPEFLMKNIKEIDNKKQRKTVRYTQVQMDQDPLQEFRRAPASPKVKAFDPGLTSRAELIIQQRKPAVFYDARGSLQPPPTYKNTSNQKLRTSIKDQNDEFAFKNLSWRAKTQFLDQNSRGIKITNRSKSKSPHDVGSNQKNHRRPEFKKIQLSLKRLISPSNKEIRQKSKETNSNIHHQYKSLTLKHFGSPKVQTRPRTITFNAY